MAVLHDFHCDEHGDFEAFTEVTSSGVSVQPCPTCGANCGHVYRVSVSSRYCAITDAEATQIYLRPGDPKPLVPADPTRPVPKKFRDLGYEKVSLRHVSEMRAFEKRTGKRIIGLHTDRSNMESD